MAGSDESRARNEKLKSYVNDRVEDINDSFDELTGVSYWICECSDRSCTEPLTASAKEYDEVRAHPRRFLILPGHNAPDLERVIEDRGSYLVVEKVGEAAEAAEREPDDDAP